MMMSGGYISIKGTLINFDSRNEPAIVTSNFRGNTISAAIKTAVLCIVISEGVGSVNNLCNLYADQGKLGEAEEMYMRALKGYEKALGVEHTSTFNNPLHHKYCLVSFTDQSQNLIAAPDPPSSLVFNPAATSALTCPSFPHGAIYAPLSSIVIQSDKPDQSSV
jgi:hypothetical protein